MYCGEIQHTDGRYRSGIPAGIAMHFYLMLQRPRLGEKDETSFQRRDMGVSINGVPP